MTLHIVLCDDDQEALNEEEALINELFKEKSLEYELKTFQSSAQLLSTHIIYDMAFLDIEMNDMNGIDLARQIAQRKKDCCIFFLTNYDKYLDKAFDVNALRFFTKPVDRERLSKGIDAAIDRINSGTKTIHVKNFSNKAEIDIEISSIIYIENVSRRTRIVSTQHDFVAEVVFSVLKENIEKEVNYFATPHQSFYVNLKYVIDYTLNTVHMSYAGKDYEAYMVPKRYKDFDIKMFGMADLLK